MTSIGKNLVLCMEISCFWCWSKYQNYWVLFLINKYNFFDLIRLLVWSKMRQNKIAYECGNSVIGSQNVPENIDYSNCSTLKTLAIEGNCCLVAISILGHHTEHVGGKEKNRWIFRWSDQNMNFNVIKARLAILIWINQWMMIE